MKELAGARRVVVLGAVRSGIAAGAAAKRGISDWTRIRTAEEYLRARRASLRVDPAGRPIAPDRPAALGNCEDLRRLQGHNRKIGAV